MADMARCIRIPASQQKFQAATEGLSVFFAVPVLAYAALTQKSLEPSLRAGLGMLAGLGLFVDGGFLATWRKNRR